MGPLLLGGIALILAIALLRAFAGADPKLLAKGLRYMGAGMLALLAVGLAISDRVGLAIFVGSAAWGLFTRGHVWPGGWPYYHFPGGGRTQPNQTTRVRTPWLEMELDHDTGEMRGTVLQGVHAGQALDSLDRTVLLALYRDAQDSETERLLEAYLDRRLGAEWRVDAGRGEAPRGRADTAMTREEALKVLGLAEGAGEEDIRAAHRRLMMQIHPDKGGSDYLAAKINEAKDVLLRR